MTSLVVALEASNGWGTGAQDGKTWHRRITNRASSEWRSYSVGGFTMQSPTVDAATMAAMKTASYTEAILLNTLGINDVVSGRTGAQLFADKEAQRITLQNAGWKVPGCTLPQSPTNDSEAQAYNTLMLAAAASYDVFVDIRTLAPDCTDATKFDTDGLHWKVLLCTSVAAAFDTALALII